MSLASRARKGMLLPDHRAAIPSGLFGSRGSANLGPMPLYLHRCADHYPDHAARGLTGDAYVVVSGNFVVGHIEPITSGPSAGGWTWGAALGGGLTEGGGAETLELGRATVVRSFRALLARADLAECPDAKAGTPVHDPPPPQPRERAPGWERDNPVGVYRPTHLTVYSGEMLIGVLTEISRGPNAGQWSWAMSGTRPNPPGFVWRGVERTLEEARAAHAACWTEWLRWAGFEQVKPIRWRSA